MSIANYRDPEIVPTLRSLLAATSERTRLRVVVLTQGDERDFAAVRGFARAARADIRQIEVAANVSQGACWARAEIQKHYDGEDFYLQLDSHIELATDWDEIVLRDHRAALGFAPKAALSAYLPTYGFAGGERQVSRRQPTDFQLNVDQGLPGAVGRFIPPSLLPPPTHFLSAHFLFSTGSFVEDVPYDPELFFFGEEITLAVRAAAAGYALHVPSRYVGAHLNQRIASTGGDRPLFWGGTEDRGRDLKWWQRDCMSKNKAVAICRGEWFGRFGIADLELYRRFAAAIRNIHGIDLKTVTAQMHVKIL